MFNVPLPPLYVLCPPPGPRPSVEALQQKGCHNSHVPVGGELLFTGGLGQRAQNSGFTVNPEKVRVHTSVTAIPTEVIVYEFIITSVPRTGYGVKTRILLYREK